MNKISLLLFVFYKTAFALPTGEPDQGRTVPELITSKGYPCEIHNVTTDDGFVLVLHRIPYGKDQNTTNKKVVFIQHGLLDSSSAWVLNNPQESLGFILADAGFDVWLGNSRGNFYSNTNIHWNPDTKEFWDWSFDQMGSSDLPSCFQYILSLTKAPSFGYVGHSQGSTSFFALASTKPQFVSNVNIFVGLAPVAYVSHNKSPLLQLAAKLNLDFLLEFFGFQEFLPSTEVLREIFPEFCFLFPSICDDIMGMIAGLDRPDLNETRWPVYVSHFPSGTSVEDIVHWAQMVRNGEFLFYDYGEDGNRKHYNSSNPPLYHLQNMPKTLKIALFSGGRDDLADLKDVDKLIHNLPAPPIFYYNEHHFAHLDFTWGKGAYINVYPMILKLLNQFAVN